MNTPEKLIICAMKLCASNLDEKGDNVENTGVFTSEYLHDVEKQQQIKQVLKHTYLPQARHQEKLNNDSSFLNLKFSNTYEAETFSGTKLLNAPNKTASWIYSNYVSQLKRAGYDASVEGIKKGKKRAKRKNDVSDKRQKS
jgi:hypothetical protein